MVRERRDFKSTIYHLWHGHQTKKDNTRFNIFNRHKSYRKEDWLEHIRRNYDWGRPNGNIDETGDDYINESLLYVYKTSTKARITLCSSIVTKRRIGERLSKAPIN